MLIYTITNQLNGKIYVGQTTKSIEHRIQSHRNSMVSGVDTHIYRAMRKYGWENFKFEVIATAQSQQELDQLEEFYIQKFDAIRSGYNMAPGGSRNVMNSPVVAAKHDAKMRTADVRQRISASMKQSYIDRGGPTAEHRKHLSEARKRLYEQGWRLPKQKLSPEHQQALMDSHNKAVYCINESGEVVASFDRVKDAAIWWHQNGYENVKHFEQCMDKIKESYKQDKFIRGLKWIYSA